MRASIALAKFNKNTVTQALNHNRREHSTASQVESKYRFGPNVHLNNYANPAALDNAKKLAKRKDAVLAIGLSMQVGKASEWRYQNGMPRRPAPLDANRLAAMALRFAREKFGAENIISVDLHMDENTPHVQILAAPIVDGKLQAKYFLDGVARCGKMRAEFMSAVRTTFPAIQFEPDVAGSGGAKHDPTKGLIQQLTNEQEESSDLAPEPEPHSAPLFRPS